MFTKKLRSYGHVDDLAIFMDLVGHCVIRMHILLRVYYRSSAVLYRRSSVNEIFSDFITISMFSNTGTQFFMKKGNSIF